MKLFIQKPQKFSLLYQKADGNVENYHILAIIERQNNLFKAYVEGKGVRTFLDKRVIDIQQLNG